MRQFSLGGILLIGALAMSAVGLYAGHGRQAPEQIGMQFSPLATRLPPDWVGGWMTGIENLEMQGEYAALERLAEAYRHVNIRFAGGEPMINEFYPALGDFAGCGCSSKRASLVAYETKLRAIIAWLAALPRSPTAAVAMARLLRQHAWSERGQQFAGDTDDERLRHFQDITHRSLAYLRPLDPRTDPAIFVGLLSAARGSDNGRGDIDRIFPAAVAAFPTYYAYYEIEADLLQERWFGAPGEARRFLASLPDLGDTGMVAYADAVGRLDGENSTSNLHHLFGIDWAVLRQAFDIRGRLYGTSDQLRNEEAKLAVVFGDRAYASTLLGEIGDRWAPSVWEERASFDRAAAWVRTGTGAPPSLD